MPATSPQPARQLSKPVYWLLHVLVFSAFLTEIRFVPSIANNVGLFEVVGGLLILAFLGSRGDRSLELPPSVRIVGLILLLAAITQIQIPEHNRLFGVIQTAILLFLFLFLITIHNLGREHQLNPGYLLKLITYAVLIVGPWVVANAFQAAGDVDLVGPFRNRAHMGTYMLTAFWLVLTYSFWPHRPKPNKLVVYAAAALCLYAVAISGRRSVYIGLAIGLAILSLAFVTARRGKRLAVVWIAVFTIGTVSALYRYSDVFPRASFFQQRIETIGKRLTMVVDSGEGAPESFYSLQRRGVRMALDASPIIGIGWGGFPDSQYSLTRHEVHSTPLRFLAETGIVGFGFYAALVACFLFSSIKMFVRMRNTEYGASFQVLAIAFWSLAVSWTYNRHITERTFFLLFAVFLLMEGMARAKQPGERRLPGPAIARGRPLTS